MWFFILLLVSLCASSQQKCQNSQHCNENEDVVENGFAHPKNLAQKINSCPTGFTGPDCKNAICYSESTIHFHDGTKDHGEDIIFTIEDGPNATIPIPVDRFIIDLYVNINGPSSRNGVLTDPSGNVVVPCLITTSGSPHQSYPVYEWQAKYCAITTNNPAGMYSFTATTNGWFTFIVEATSSLVVDGGFVTDPRDDNVQQRPPASHNAVERDPKPGVPSYFAFALSAKGTTSSVDIVSYVGINSVTTTYKVDKRYNCGADNIFIRPFTCSTTNYYSDGQYDLNLTGADDQGNTWVRRYSFKCPIGSKQKQANDRTQCTCRKGCSCSNEEAAKLFQERREKLQKQKQKQQQ